MEEDVNRRTVSITITTAKLSTQALVAAFRKVLAAWQKHQQKGLTHHGPQTVKQLVGQGAAINSVPLEEHADLFDRVARKYGVDYAFQKTGPKQYQLFFKAGQADVITAAFKEYTALLIKKERTKQAKAKERPAPMERTRQPQRQRQRTREAARDGR